MPPSHVRPFGDLEVTTTDILAYPRADPTFCLERWRRWQSP